VNASGNCQNRNHKKVRSSVVSLLRGFFSTPAIAALAELGPNFLTGHPEPVMVDRRHNVLGSGSLHMKKFFPSAREFLRGTRPNTLIDVGCGDGQFLANASAEWPGISIAAIDLSQIAIDTTLKRLAISGHKDVIGIVENGIEVSKWAASLPEALRIRSQLVLSMWFVVHEFVAVHRQKE
jgi:hypothetical protein